MERPRDRRVQAARDLALALPHEPRLQADAALALRMASKLQEQGAEDLTESELTRFLVDALVSCHAPVGVPVLLDLLEREPADSETTGV